MLEWLKQRLQRAPAAELVPPDEAMRRLRQVVSDAAFEDVWEAMDHHASALEPHVRAAIEAGELGPYPLHAAVIWLGYTAGGDGRTIAAQFVDQLESSIGWALGFEENTVLLGAALGALDALGEATREEVALRLFADAGPTRPRRYWLLLKVRTDAMMQLVVAALADFEPPPDGDPDDEEFVYTPTAANRMAGAFRQFQSDDFDLVRRHFDQQSPGAQFLVEALGATQHPEALPLLREAATDDRSAVARIAQRWLRVIDS